MRYETCSDGLEGIWGNLYRGPQCLASDGRETLRPTVADKGTFKFPMFRVEPCETA